MDIKKGLVYAAFALGFFVVLALAIGAVLAVMYLAGEYGPLVSLLAVAGGVIVIAFFLGATDHS